MAYEEVIWTTNIGFTVIVVILCLYYIMRSKRLDELARRLLLVGFFFAVHELSFFLFDTFIYELTKTLFFLTLFYALVYIISVNAQINKRLEKEERISKELKERLSRLKEEVG
jgi:RsiW-degrading membrane proteinase PrsW (M82 family)